MIVRKRGVGDFSTIASTIQTIEGWFPGSLSQQNNNPGNLRPAGQSGCTPVGGVLLVPDACSGTTGTRQPDSLGRLPRAHYRSIRRQVRASAGFQQPNELCRPARRGVRAVGQ